MLRSGLAAVRWQSLGSAARSEKAYVNFDLRIERNGQPAGYSATCTSKGSGEGRHTFQLAVDEQDGALSTLLSCARDRGVRRPHSPMHLQRARELGDLLFATVFDDSIGTCFKQELVRVKKTRECLRVRLWLAGAPELARLPWELLYDASLGSFLLHDPILSLVRYLEMLEPAERPAAPPPLCILVVMTRPANCPRLAGEEELQRLKEALGELLASGQVRMHVLEHATLAAIEKAMRDQSFQVVHYIGHGVHGPERPSGALVLESKGGRADPVDGRDLAAVLGHSQDLRLVVLNACEGGISSTSDAFAGVAQGLVRHGVPMVVAMRSVISDQAAIIFGHRFYEELARGVEVDYAVSSGRRALHSERLCLEWASPLLFMRSSNGRVVTPPRSNWWVKALLGAGLCLGMGWLAREAGWLSRLAPLLPGVPVEWLSPSSDPSLDTPPAPPRRVDVAQCPPPRKSAIPFVLIPRGEFWMGADVGPRKNRPSHSVKLTQPLCVGIYEVTQAQWQAYMGKDSVKSPVKGANVPITNVSRADVNRFLERLNAEEPEAHYRLLTEAQWEYAAKAGAAAGTQPATGGSVRNGNCKGRGPGDPWKGVAPVGQYPPNDFGLHDMTGNVWEWVGDPFDRYEPLTLIDPPGSGTGETWVRRGGAHDSALENCTSVTRSEVSLTRSDKFTGFRLARDPIIAPVSPAN